jgi:hypothetical protein
VKNILIFFLACLLFPACAISAKGETDVLIQRAPVPAAPPYQGEVRLIRRDSSLVIQTILNSRVMRHVVAAIQKKEFHRWPEDREDWLDSRRYSEELYHAYEISLAEAQKRQSDSRYLQLMIELVLEERRSYFAIYAPTLTQDGDRFSVQAKRLLKKRKTSRNYTYRNILEIAQDSFDLEPHEALDLLRPIPKEY